MSLSKLSSNNQPSIKCWTEWLRKTRSKLADDLQDVFANQSIQLRDERFGWTLTHGIAGGSAKLKLQVLNNYFEYLKREGLLCQLCEQDNEGDLPLQSAINSHAPAEVIELILSVAPDLTKEMLCSQNGTGETSLKLAFDQCQWETVELILDLCIKHEVLSNLTGVLRVRQETQANTLLHRAFKKGHFEYLKRLLKVCRARNVNILPVLLVPNKHSRTPWFYLVTNRSVADCRQAIELVEEYSIAVNSLYADSKTKSTMLHRAYRYDKKGLIKLLKQHKANEEQPDQRRLLPRERSRSFIEEDQDACDAPTFRSPDSTVSASKEVPSSDDVIALQETPEVQSNPQPLLDQASVLHSTRLPL